MPLIVWNICSYASSLLLSQTIFCSLFSWNTEAFSSIFQENSYYMFFVYPCSNCVNRVINLVKHGLHTLFCHLFNHLNWNNNLICTILNNFCKIFWKIWNHLICQPNLMDIMFQHFYFSSLHQNRWNVSTIILCE